MDRSAAHLDPSAFLGAARERSRALVIEGPAGIGKTHGWTAVLEAARAAGWRILRARPSQAETRLVGSALIDLCGDLERIDLAALPAPQRSALESALLRSDTGSPPDPGAVAIAFSSIVRALAPPVLIAVDDVQWLDAQTSAVLAYAARRLPDFGVAVLLAVRVEPEHEDPELVVEISGAIPSLRHAIAPMPREEVERLVEGRVGASLPAAALRRVLEDSGGNPLYAVEIAQALAASDVAGHVPLPRSLDRLVGQRVRRLSPPTRLALAAAAALTRPTLEELARLQLDDALGDAELAGLVRMEGSDVHFRHPLYAAAAYEDLSGNARMQLHARLASVVTAPEERARHLALGTAGPDADVAAVLDRAVTTALARGAVHAALDACRLSLRATTDDDPQAYRRRIRLGELLFHTGDTTRAHDELHEVAYGGAADALTRARALVLLAEVLAEMVSRPTAISVLHEALGLVPEDGEIAADIHLRIGGLVNSIDKALEHGQLAVVLLKRLPSPAPARLARALADLADNRLRAGHGADFASLDLAAELERQDPSARLWDRSDPKRAEILLYVDELGSARALYRTMYQAATDEGDDTALAWVAHQLAHLERFAGNFPAARDWAKRSLHLASRAGLETVVRSARSRIAWLDAQCGPIEDAEAFAEEMVSRGNQDGVYVQLWGHGLLGYCRHVRGNYAEAVVHFEQVKLLADGIGLREPSHLPTREYHVEALIAAGDLVRAAEVLNEYAERAEAVGRRSALAAAARCRALLLAARNDRDSALAAAAEALERYDSLDRPYDRSRALLTEGQIHRRFRQKALAKRSLAAALAEFESLGALPYAARAREELSRIGLRPSAPLGLTQSEQRVAELAAVGQTTAEIAAALFLSQHTVTTYLTRIYRKLGVRNRAELTARLPVPAEGSTRT